MDSILAALEVAAGAMRKQTQQPAMGAGSKKQGVAKKSVAKAAPGRAESRPAAAPPAPAKPRSEPLQALFQDGNTLLRAIVASEVLAPPRALRENDLWRQPNEPLT